MGKHDDNIDFEVLALSSGLFDTLPPPPPRTALHYPGRAVDFEVLDLDGGIFDSTLPPPPRAAILPPPPAFVPRHDSIAPMIAADPVEETLPQIPVQRLRFAPMIGAAAAFALMALAVLVKPGSGPAAAASPRVEPTIVVPLQVAAPKPTVVMEAAPSTVAPAPAKPAARARAASPKAPAASAAEPAAPAMEKAPDDLQIAPVAAPPPPKDIDMAAASRAVAAAAHGAASCLDADDGRVTMPVSLTFAPSGRVTSAKVTGGPFMGSEIGGCIARALRGASVAPFDGEPVTVSTTARLR